MDAATKWIAGVEQDAFELLAQRNVELVDEKARLAEQLERAEAALAAVGAGGSGNQSRSR